MKFLTYKCPCCENQFSVFRLVFSRALTGCKHKLEHKCLYCPACSERISNEVSTWWTNLFQGISVVVMLISWIWIAAYSSWYIGLISAYFISSAVLLLLLGLAISKSKLTCCKDVDQERSIVNRSNSSMLLFPIDDGVDASELKWMRRIQFILFGVPIILATMGYLIANFSSVRMFMALHLNYFISFVGLILLIYLLKDRLVLKEEKEE